MMALTLLTAPTPTRAHAHLCAERDRHRGRVAAVGRRRAVVRFDRRACSSERAQLDSDPTTSAEAAASACRNWRSRDLLNFPNGMGPFEFSRVHGTQQHNVYLQAFLVYGWVGGMAYIMLLVATLWVGLRTVLRAHAVAALSDLRLRHFRRRSARRLHHRHRSLAAFLSYARDDLGNGRRDVETCAQAMRRCQAGRARCPRCLNRCRGNGRTAAPRRPAPVVAAAAAADARCDLFFNAHATDRAGARTHCARRIPARHRRPVLDRERRRRRRPPRLCRARRRGLTRPPLSISAPLSARTNFRVRHIAAR